MGELGVASRPDNIMLMQWYFSQSQTSSESPCLHSPKSNALDFSRCCPNTWSSISSNPLSLGESVQFVFQGDIVSDCSQNLLPTGLLGMWPHEWPPYYRRLLKVWMQMAVNQCPDVVLAKVLGYPASVRVGPGTKALVWFRNRQESEPPKS
jgi:hypothetical protein